MPKDMSRFRYLLVPLTCGLPPAIAYALHSRHDSREIVREEIVRSRDGLTRLSPPSGLDGRVRVASPSTGQGPERHHLQNLARSGVTCLPKILRAEEVAAWNDRLRAAFADDASGDTEDRRRGGRVRSDRGRLHSHQESPRSPHHSNFLEQVASMPELQSLVKTYFSRHSIERYKLTQLQFLVAKPGSEHQIWHRDNVAPGLTLLIALEDVGGNGPTELLTGSHLTGDSLLDGSNGVLLGCLNKGDAILYDSRVIHRGRGYCNGTSSDFRKNDALYHEDRPVLVIRWDALATPPPGAGIIVTNWIAWLGSFQTFILEMKDSFQKAKNNFKK